jgi:hypothetical protein
MRHLRCLILVLFCNPVWAAFRSSGTAVSAASGSTSIVPGSPAGLAADDIILCILSMDIASGAGTFASGFVVLNTNSITTPDAQTVKLAWKRAVGGDTLTITSITSATTKVAQCHAWSGRDTGNPPITATSATNSASNASPTTVTSNGVTAVAGDDLAWFVALDVNATSVTNTLTPPTGYTNQGSGNDSISFSPIALASKDNVTAGATGTVSGSITHSGSSGWFAFLVRLPVVPASTGTGSMFGGASMTAGPSLDQ